MFAENENAVAVKLNQLGYTPTSILETKKPARLLKFLIRGIRVKFSDLIMFTRQLSTLQKAVYRFCFL